MFEERSVETPAPPGADRFHRLDCPLDPVPECPPEWLDGLPVWSLDPADVPDTDDTGDTDAATADPGTADPGSADPSSADPSSADPSSADPSSADPSSADPSSADSGTVASGQVHDHADRTTDPDRVPDRVIIDTRNQAEPGARAAAQVGGEVGAQGGGAPHRKRGSAGPRPAAAGKPLVHVVMPYPTLIGVDDQPCQLAGYGPVPAQLAREIAADAVWKRLVTNPLSGALLDHGRATYRPPAALAEFVRARDGGCRSPICRRQPANCELDHALAWADGGVTADHNLWTGCVHDHHLKHQPGWTVRMLPRRPDRVDHPDRAPLPEQPPRLPPRRPRPTPAPRTRHNPNQQARQARPTRPVAARPGRPTALLIATGRVLTARRVGRP
jgi:Domain of unknown function (DUF222)